jgi:hypothetical protein
MNPTGLHALECKGVETEYQLVDNPPVEAQLASNHGDGVTRVIHCSDLGKCHQSYL